MILFVSLSFCHQFRLAGRVLKIHILGICGTFMGGLACAGPRRWVIPLHHRVRTESVYSAVSTQLRTHWVSNSEGYAADQFKTSA